MSAVYNLLVDLAACVSAELAAAAEKDLVPTAETVVVAPGDHVIRPPVSEDGCGKAWVRLLGSYKAEGVGLESTQPGNCGKELGIEIEVGIVRCMSWGEDDGTPPDAATELEAARVQFEDMALILRAIQCCDALDEDTMLIRTYAPTGPRGLLYGGSWQVATVV